MTNAEKFKTAKERAHKFSLFCESQKNGCNDCELTSCSGDECRYAWLELEYKEELKPCPFCGHNHISVYKGDLADVWFTVCAVCGCRTEGHTSEETAIAAWNRRVK